MENNELHFETMSDLKTILDNVLPAFIGIGQPEQINAELRKHGCLTDNECFYINKQQYKTEQFLEIFKCLKARPTEALQALQKMCLECKWSKQYELIREHLTSIKRTDLFLLTKEENEYRRCFMHEVREPVAEFSGRQKQLDDIHDTITKQNTSRLLITGLGGVGKTQLVLYFIKKYEQKFENIVWLEAESEVALKKSISNLAQRLDIPTSNVELKVLADKIYDNLSSKGCNNIVIFDNADEINVEKFWPTDLNKFFVLITSRKQVKVTKSKIDLNVFTIEEANEFIKLALKTEELKNCGDIEQLATALQCLPLALGQATSYINNQNKLIGPYTIDEYLTDYNTEFKSQIVELLLSYVPVDNETDSYYKTVFATWQVTFKQIERSAYPYAASTGNQLEESSLAVLRNLPSQILNIIAYFGIDSIPVNWFFENANNDRNKLMWAIELLTHYSLIYVYKSEEREREKGTERLLKVHKLVQLVTRLNQSTDERDAFVTAATNVLLKQFPAQKKDLSTFYKKLNLQFHIDELQRHVANLKNENQLNDETVSNVSYLQQLTRLQLFNSDQSETTNVYRKKSSNYKEFSKVF